MNVCLLYYGTCNISVTIKEIYIWIRAQRNSRSDCGRLSQRLWSAFAACGIIRRIISIRTWRSTASAWEKWRQKMLPITWKTLRWITRFMLETTWCIAAKRLLQVFPQKTMARSKQFWRNNLRLFRLRFKKIMRLPQATSAIIERRNWKRKSRTLWPRQTWKEKPRSTHMPSWRTARFRSFRQKKERSTTCRKSWRSMTSILLIRLCI